MLTIEQKITVLSEYASELIDNATKGAGLSEDERSFLKINNLGIPFAIGLSNNYITLTKEGEFLIEETFLDMCKLLEVNPFEDYKDEDDFWDSIEYEE